MATNKKRKHGDGSDSDEEPSSDEGNNELRKCRRKSGSNKSQNEGTPSPVTKPASTTSDCTDICPLGNPAKELDRGSSKGNMAIRASLDMNNEEYILKLTSVPIDDAEAEQARMAAVLLSQGEILRKLGQKLLSQIGASYSLRSRL